MISRENCSLDVVMYRRTTFEAPRPSGASESVLDDGSVAISRSAKSRRKVLLRSGLAGLLTICRSVASLALDTAGSGLESVRSVTVPSLSVSHVTRPPTKWRP